jgi:hypothetical protein
MSDVSVKFAAEDLNLTKTITGIQKDLASLDAKTKNTSKGFDMSFGKIGLAAGVAGAAVKVGMMAVESATAAARAVVDGFGDAINLGGRLNDLSSRTGETAGNLLLLERAFQNSGVGADKVGQSVNKLQKFMAEASAGGASQTATLTALGLSMSDLAGKTPTEQMQALAQKIAGISDPSERARAAMDIFGKSGGELLPLLNNFSGELGEAQRQLGSLPGVMDRSNVAFDSLGDQLGAMKSKTMEFAAGFIESALPALNAFTKSLSGIDAAGWGQKLMDQTMRVADFLIGAFKAPMPAIEAIGASLEAGLKIAGNALFNSFITAGDFLQKLFSSDLPGLIAGQFGAGLSKMVVDFAKFFVDRINEVVKGFEQFFGSAIESIVGFFSRSFSSIVNAFAADFKNAMSDPIGFVTGKFDSALNAVTQGGALTFKTSFDNASGSVLDKISAGLGDTSAMYGEKLTQGGEEIRDQFGKLVSEIEPSARDFFGAKTASEEAAEKFGEVESVGQKLRKDFEGSATAAADANTSTADAAESAEAVAGSFDKAAGGAAKIKSELSESAKLLNKINEAQAGEAVDKGGRLQAKAQDQIAAGDFAGARNTARQIENREIDASIRGVGAGRDTRSIGAIGSDFGLKQQLGENSRDFTQRVKDVREGRAVAGKFGRSSAIDSVAAPGQDGQTAEQAKKSNDSPDKQGGLEKFVSDIYSLLKDKIEPKLPVAALTA